MEMPRPTEEHRKLDRLVGKWTGTEIMHPSPWDPKGGSATGRMENNMRLDGFAVVQEYEQERGGAVTFRGHGVFRWDPAAKCYVLYWFDSMGFPPHEYRGTFEGDVLNLTTKDSQGLSRTLFDFSKDGAYTFKMQASKDGNNWQTLMEGSYRKER